MQSTIRDFSNINLTTNKPIKEKILLLEQERLREFGYNTKLKELVITKELIHKIIQLGKIRKPKIKTTSNMTIRFKQIARAQKFLNKYFKLHSVYTDINTMTHPFNVTISFNSEQPFFGTVNTGIINKHNKNANIIYAIELSKNITNLTGAIYTHEIVHSQLMTQFGSIKELYNHEVLPIFIELLYILEYNNKNNNLFELHDYIRLKALTTYFQNILLSKILPMKTNYDLIDHTMFTISTITAYKLFNLYVNGSIKQREYIINNIQSIFDGNYQLDDFLKELHINFDYKTKRKVLECNL